MLFRIILIIILAFLVITGIQRLILNYFKKRLLNVVEDRFAGRRIILMALDANFFGRKTARAGRIRGNGALVLTDDELWFCLAAPKREIVIPIGNVESVELKRSHLGKTMFRPLLGVSFSFQGQTEQIAWYVNKADKWKNAIENLMR